MPWVVDTCLLIDVAEADPAFGTASEVLRVHWFGALRSLTAKS